ncbi:MAG TPA: DoxX family protein [Acidobacteriaceae bacterium]|nr:DoxX family protein [Acidobacteriaceae bacterium]
MKSSSGSSSSGTDIGLLLLRVISGLSLFIKHGVEKLTNHAHMASHFPDPVHIGRHPSFLVAMVSDAICSMLVVLGLGTRVAAFIIFMNLGVALYFVHHLAFRTEHAEMMVAYMAGFVTLVFTGAGRFSLDWKFWGRS